MGAIIKKYNLEVVQESSKRYEVEKQITSSIMAKEVLKEVFRLDKQSEEVLCLLCLDTKNKVVGAFEVSRGTVNSSSAHPREIFKRAMLMNSARIMIGHNHPSGDVSPSSADDRFTSKIVNGGEILGIEVLDHIIVGGGNNESYSYAEEGMLL